MKDLKLRQAEGGYNVLFDQNDDKRCHVFAVDSDFKDGKAFEITEGIARRIVACVNACEGISTENLTDNVPLKQGLSGLNKRIRDAEAQRDDLLAALEDCLYRIDCTIVKGEATLLDIETAKKARAALARAKGGAA